MRSKLIAKQFSSMSSLELIELYEWAQENYETTKEFFEAYYALENFFTK